MSSRITVFGFGKADFLFYGPGWQDPMGDRRGEQKALTKLVDLQGKPQSRRCFLLTGKRQTTHLQERQAGSGEL